MNHKAMEGAGHPRKVAQVFAFRGIHLQASFGLPLDADIDQTGAIHPDFTMAVTDGRLPRGGRDKIRRQGIGDLRRKRG